MRLRVAPVIVIGALLLPLPAAADWKSLWQADMRLELATAREIALDTVATDPASPDAVAAAAWWLEHIDHVPAAEEMLAAAGNLRDPELGFYLGLIEHALDLEAPPACLPAAEVSGAFGGFTTLDLERDVVPGDADLPRLETRWQNPADPFRVRLRTLDGFLAPPRTMVAEGIHLVAYDVVVARDTVGWLVVEAHGGYNLEVDGVDVDRRRDCGLSDPATNWYRVRLDEGRHRIRLQLGGDPEPRVRVSLVDDRGAAIAAVTVSDENRTVGEPAASKAARAEPPAAARITSRLEEPGVVLEDLMLAAELARGRGDPETAVELYERAREVSPADPAVSLAYARLLVLEGGVRAPATARKIGRLLRDAQSIPGSKLVAHAVAVHEHREDDADRLLEELLTAHVDDVRVLRRWVREAVARGWLREAEESLAKMEAALPGSTSVTGLRLEVLESLERWRERDNLLRALASSVPVETRWIGELASSCLIGEAVAATRPLVERLRDPDLDLQLIRLLLESSDLESASALLASSRARWGDLPAFDELLLMLSAAEDGGVERELPEVLERSPSNLQLLALAWRGGEEPFYVPFQVDGLEFAAAHRDFGAGSDAVLLLDQAVERIFADGSSLYYYHGLTRANTPVGAQRASQLQPLPDANFITLRIIKPDGRVVVPVDARPGVDSLSLTEVEPGDLVEEEYVARVGTTGSSRRGHLPPYLYRFADPDRAFGRSEYVLLVPPDVDLQVDGNFEGLQRDEREWRGLRMLQWRAEDVPPVPLEPFAPPAQDLMPWLNYGFGVSWADVGDTFRDRFLPVLRTSPELRAWGRELLVGATAEDRVRSLVRGLVDEIEPGGGEIALDTAAADSFAIRRGNRLGVLAALLADAGWQVDVVLTRPWTERGQRLQVPTLDAFPVALLRVEEDSGEIWIDIREELRGVNSINPLMQGSDGLVLPLTRPLEPAALTARLPSFDNPGLVEEMKVRAEVATNGDARVSFRMALRGNQAERLKQRLETVPAEQVEIVFRQIATTVFPGAAEVVGGIDDSAAEPTIMLDMVVEGACEADDQALECRSLVLSNPLVPLFASLPERSYPLVLPVPIRRVTELEIVAPPGFGLEDRRPRQVETEWGSVGETLDRGGASARSILEVSLPRQTVATDDYPAFARFCRAVDELTSRPPVLVQRP